MPTGPDQTLSLRPGVPTRVVVDGEKYRLALSGVGHDDDRGVDTAIVSVLHDRVEQRTRVSVGDEVAAGPARWTVGLLDRADGSGSRLRLDPVAP